MATVVKTQAEIMLEIVKAAFTTHYNSTKRPDWSDAETHWNQNPQAQVLWAGLVKGIITNVGAAQAAGELPKLLSLDVRAPLLQGLGGVPIAAGNPGPADLARKLAADIRRSERPAADVPGASRPRALSGNDVHPGLAIERQDVKGDKGD